MTRSTSNVRPLKVRLSSFLFRKRRLLAAAALCAAAGITVEAFLPHEPELVQVVAATTDLPVGSVLAPGQLSLVSVPKESAPRQAFGEPDLLAGQQLATPVFAGDIISKNFLVGAGLLAGMPAGTVAVPLRPADASTVQLLSAGQHVDVVLSTGNGFEVDAKNTVLARNVAVLWTSQEATSGPFATAGGEADALVVVAAGPEEAASLAGASSNGQVHLVLTSGD